MIICHSKKDGKDQESIQSSTTPDPRHHMGKSALVVLLYQNGIKWGVFVRIGDTYMPEKFLTKIISVLFF